MAVLDTNFLIAMERGQAKALQRAEGLFQHRMPLRIAAAAWIEYLAGVPLKRRPAIQADLDQTATFEPFTRDCAALAIRLQADLMERGARMNWNDLQIAATALHYDEPVISNDLAFDDVPGLVRLGF